MGQNESIPKSDYIRAIEEYKKLQMRFDEVDDELTEMYAEYDANRAAQMRKHGKLSKLGNRFDRDDRVINQLTDEDHKHMDVCYHFLSKAF